MLLQQCPPTKCDPALLIKYTYTNTPAANLEHTALCRLLTTADHPTVPTVQTDAGPEFLSVLSPSQHGDQTINK